MLPAAVSTLRVLLFALLVAIPTACHTSVGAVRPVGGGRYTISATSSGLGADDAYNAAVAEAHRFCRQQKKGLVIESSTGSASGGGKSSMSEDNQRIYFKCRSKKRAMKARRRKAEKPPLLATADRIGGDVGTVRNEQWTDSATGLSIATYEYTLRRGFVLRLKIREMVDDSLSKNISVSIIAESTALRFSDDALIALIVDGGTPLVTDTAWSVHQLAGQPTHESIEGTISTAKFVEATKQLNSLEVRVHTREFRLSTRALIQLRTFIRIADEGFTVSSAAGEREINLESPSINPQKQP